MSRRVGAPSSAGSGIKKEHVPLTKTRVVAEVEGPLKLDEGDDGIKDETKQSLSLDERFELERHNAKMKHWKENPFAAGLVEVTWKDQLEQSGNCCGGSSRATPAWAQDEIHPDSGGCTCCSAWICSKLGAGRIGNMAVLQQSQEWVEEVTLDEETGESTTRRYTQPKLNFVVGPYWPMLMFVTYPLILGVSGWTWMTALPGKPLLLQIVWGFLSFGLVFALFQTAFRDPGIMRKRRNPPPQEEAQWRWSDAGQTYRPRGAVYDTDTAVVVEQFDHTCPWTGTAIGKNNMLAFQCFVGLVFFCLIMDILLLTGAF
mmetsp:Transcript_30523/g.45193  ORF Transcript_30523/g.45193 Transcript_30523/m.45193 type:complete len:315 (-) Transcript_30523:275-1219(-)